MQLRVFLALIPLFAALVVPAQAQRMADGETLDRILPDIRAQHPGRLSDAQPWTDENGRTHYRIKWMTPEGRILYFDADTRTGRYWSSDGLRDPRDSGPRNSSADRPPRGEDGDNRAPPDDRSRRHDNWNGDQGPFGNDYGPPRSRDGAPHGGDWRGNGDWRSGGDWHGGHGGNYGGGHHQGHGGN
jgi:hypothetical protein